jgi:hypothetical protein
LRQQPEAASIAPKRTGHNKLLFSDLNKQDACTDPNLLFEICRPGTRGV